MPSFMYLITALQIPNEIIAIIKYSIFNKECLFENTKSVACSTGEWEPWFLYSLSHMNFPLKEYL